MAQVLEEALVVASEVEVVQEAGLGVEEAVDSEVAVAKAVALALVVASEAELVVVAFRGTRPFDAAGWCADLDPSWYKIPRLGRALAAYTHALGAQRNIGWPKWVEHIKGKPQKVRSWIASLMHTHERRRR